MKRALILCAGNSCRSQLAEALINARLAGEWRAESAGTAPTGAVHPLALAALREIGIEHAGRSKHADEFRGQSFDLVVTVCDAAAEACPVWPGAARKVHLPFPDPAKAVGTEEDVMAAFRRVRDAIAEQVVAVVAAA